MQVKAKRPGWRYRGSGGGKRVYYFECPKCGHETTVLRSEFFDRLLPERATPSEYATRCLLYCPICGKRIRGCAND